MSIVDDDIDPIREVEKFRRVCDPQSDVLTVNSRNAPIEVLLEIYDEALPEVYGYVRRRVDSDQAAEDVTAEAFLAAVTALRKRPTDPVGVPWLIGIARHKVVDHWRKREREQRRVDALTQAVAVGAGLQPKPVTPATDEIIEAHLADWTLSKLAAPYRAALTLRYLDDLPVQQVADHLDRTTGATEALLTRAKTAFRQAYPWPDEAPPVTAFSVLPHAKHLPKGRS